MSTRRPPDPSLLVVACFSRHLQALDWAQARLVETYGRIERVSPDFDFHHTDYYLPTMGAGLKKRLVVFAEVRPSDILPDVKIHSIGLEAECARSGLYPDERPLNLDPGLLQLGKFLLATTKDQGHRIYLRDGIYAEVTLRYEGKSFECWPWTYADYREPTVREFLYEARGALHGKLHPAKPVDHPS